MIPHTSPGTISHVAVIIPARNESATIAHTLESVATAAARLDGRATTSCVIVADACVDDTAQTARQWFADNGRLSAAMGTSWLSVIECNERSAGAARRVGTTAALANTPDDTPVEALWLANTDADTTVDAHWLELQLDLAHHGVDAVAGIVELDENVPDDLLQRFAVHYTLNPDGTHRHVHGANIAMRASTYLAAGGWSNLRTGEDHDLWKRLNMNGNCISSTAVTVRTSARTTGRAPNGFAADISSLLDPNVVA